MESIWPRRARTDEKFFARHTSSYDRGRIGPSTSHILIHHRYTMRLKLKAAQSDLRAIGITLRKIEGEYQVYPKFRSDLAYFTTDIEDAFNTGRIMATERAALRF